jgi:hypothetical protein
MRRKPQVEVQGCSNNPLELKEHKHLGHKGPKNKIKHYLKRKEKTQNGINNVKRGLNTCSWDLRWSRPAVMNL